MYSCGHLSYWLLFVLLCHQFTESLHLNRQPNVPKAPSTISVQKGFSVQMKNSAPFSSKAIMKSLATIAATLLVTITPLDPSAISTFFTSITPPAAIAVVAPGVPSAPSLPTISLEQSVQNLETADNRKDALQAMADVFETSGARSLQARTKYKQRIITAINNQHIRLNNNWDQALSYASGEVKRRVDPYRTIDLSSYLKIAPLVGGGCYLGALLVQNALSELFVFAYPAAVFVFVAPILYTLAFT